MSNLVGENYAYEAADKGTKIGELPPSKETKDSWSELYFYENKIISVIFYDTSSCYIADGELVDENDIAKYTNDLASTISVLSKLQA
jgi:hypothetical protein